MCKNLLMSICLAAFFVAADEREVTFYEVRPVTQRPVLDGDLNDAVWQDAQVLSRYYQYGRPNPEVSQLRSEFRALYDERGLYVGIVNYDDKIDMLRTDILSQDSIELWRDDCAELYFDPEASGIGHTIFTVNALGIKGDRKRLDTAVSLPDWNGTGWQSSASIGKDRWTLELFFPWEDLGRKAHAGELWQFLHNRYAWKPRFIGAASAAGADYRSTEKFGYLFFAGKEQITPQRIAEILERNVQRPCFLLTEDKMIRFGDSDTRIESLEAVVRSVWEEYSLALVELKALHTGKVPDAALHIVKRCSELSKVTPLAAYLQLRTANRELFRLKWEYYLNLNFNLNP